eukprot:scaffold464_cov181-Amphora_coffeaeformis.AAC.2
MVATSLSSRSKSKSSTLLGACSTRTSVIAGCLVCLLCILAFRGNNDYMPILIPIADGAARSASQSALVAASPSGSETASGQKAKAGGVADPVLAQSLRRTAGDDWKVNPEPNDLNYKCKWIDFVSTSGKAAKFCGHSDPDGVTTTIEKRQRFHHCNVLPTMWKQAPKKSNSIYLEIGANIGACVMEMLLSTDARIIAFEPHPKNLFVLQQSIAALDQSYQDRVVLVPVALGPESTTNTIYAAEGNMGNSVVGKIIKDNNRQKFSTDNQFTIHVERLDSILSEQADVAFVKLDAQGYECNILEGISNNLAQQIHKVKFEVAPKWLKAQGCSDLMSRFRNKGYTLFSENMKRKYETEEYTSFRGMVELVAARE